jgi:hypothetical protein
VQIQKHFSRFSQATRDSRCAALREFAKSAQRASNYSERSRRA